MYASVTVMSFGICFEYRLEVFDWIVDRVAFRVTKTHKIGRFDVVFTDSIIFLSVEATDIQAYNFNFCFFCFSDV